VTIRKGEPWGTPVTRPTDLVIALGDAEVVDASRANPTKPVGLAGGDLFRSLGSPGPRQEMQELPIDLMEVELDGDAFLAVAHVVVRRGWWRGPVVAVMNVDHIGAWNVAPRAHPNDGRLDVVEVDTTMSVRQRWQARKRLPTGTHLPHPCIAVRTAATFERTFSRPQTVWVDGVSVAAVRSVQVRIRPDACSVLV
jgi:hypothetical protein